MHHNFCRGDFKCLFPQSMCYFTCVCTFIVKDCDAIIGTKQWGESTLALVQTRQEGKERKHDIIAGEIIFQMWIGIRKCTLEEYVSGNPLVPRTNTGGQQSNPCNLRGLFDRVSIAVMGKSNTARFICFTSYVIGHCSVFQFQCTLGLLDEFYHIQSE